jgi:hypothetical protein
MTENPTLRRGDEGADGWVEYLQTLLRVQGFTGTPQFGVFDDVTEHWVRLYQEYRQLKVDGIVGDQTWSSLRQEPEVQPVGDDGRDPHTHTERGDRVAFHHRGVLRPVRRLGVVSGVERRRHRTADGDHLPLRHDQAPGWDIGRGAR